MRYAERGWTNYGSQEESSEEESNQEESQKEVAFYCSPMSGTAGGLKAPGVFDPVRENNLYWCGW
jgi:hypothetical protein